METFNFWRSPRGLHIAFVLSGLRASCSILFAKYPMVLRVQNSNHVSCTHNVFCCCVVHTSHIMIHSAMWVRVVETLALNVEQTVHRAYAQCLGSAFGLRPTSRTPRSNQANRACCTNSIFTSAFKQSSWGHLNSPNLHVASFHHEGSAQTRTTNANAETKYPLSVYSRLHKSNLQFCEDHIISHNLLLRTIINMKKSILIKARVTRNSFHCDVAIRS